VDRADTKQAQRLLVRSGGVREPQPRLGFERLASALGARLTGFTSASVDSDALAPVLARGLLDHQLVLLRGVDLDAERFRRVGLLLGSLRRVPYGMQRERGMLDVQRLTNLDDNGARTGANPDPYSLYWHTDGSAAHIPSRYTLLYAIRVPARGGDTSFVNMYDACAALPPARRRRLVGRLAVHDPDVARPLHHRIPIAPADADLRTKLRMRLRFVRRMLSSRAARHPVIRIHEETGRTCLFLGDHAWRVTGSWWPAGIRLANDVNAFATSRPEWIYTHAWQPGDLVVWDNRCVLHRGSAYDTAAEDRVMLRSVVEGVVAPIPATA
jgi:taurine dioxygenase